MARASVIVHTPGLGDRLVNQGGLNVTFVYNALEAWMEDVLVRRLDVRFRKNVFAGDEIRAGGVVTAVQETNPGQLVDVWLECEDGERVLTGMAVIHLK